MNIIISLFITIITGIFAFITFILAQCKDEILETIVFKDDLEAEQRK